MNKIFDVADQTERKQRLKRYFDQIGLITSMRDKLIHSGVQFDENTHEFVWNNIKAAHIEEKYTQFNVSADMLDDLTTDISQIIFGLSYEFGKDSMPDEAAEWLRQKMRPTWRYKPPQRVVRRRKKTDTPQELQSQPGKHDLELRAADYPAQVESDT